MVFFQRVFPSGAHEVKKLNFENEKIITEEGLFFEIDYPLKIKPKFSNLGSIIENSRQEPLIGFALDYSIHDF